jgi:retinol dehydrogenase-12
MKEKNILITGGNAGIGLATAIALAKQGATIYIVSRSKEKAVAAVAQIKEVSKNKNVHYFLADLSSQKSVRNLAKQINNDLRKLDVLINNAGGVFSEFQLSEDGIEMTLATNHFSFFLLTNLLLDLLKNSDNARIVNVSSDSHYKGKIDFNSFTQNQDYFILKAYEQSKLANVFFTQELAKRLKDHNVTVNALHPGFVNTNIGTKGTQWYANWIWSLASKIGGLSIENGAKTSIYLASSDEVKNVTGKYFDKCKSVAPSKISKDEKLQKEIWEISEKLCPIS